MINMDADIKISLGTATDLYAFADESFDVVLCLGPLYHLKTQIERDNWTNKELSNHKNLELDIDYKDIKVFKSEELGGLFLSVNWSSGKYPENLKIAMENSHTVFSAWDGDKLVGLINSLSDGIMTAYFHYLLIRPEYQGQGIGENLVNSMLEKYKDYSRKVLISYDKEIGFYEHCGFKIGEGSTPMVITFLTT